MKYGVRETSDRVKNIAPDLCSRFRWRAERRARKLNATRRFPSYRWEVVEEAGGFAVIAFQNVAELIEVIEDVS
jgi:hypothetical protein